LKIENLSPSAEYPERFDKIGYHLTNNHMYSERFSFLLREIALPQRNG